MRARRWLLAAAVLAAGLVPAMTPAGLHAEEGCTPDLGDAPVLPVGTSDCTGARPGNLVRSPHGLCTLGFVFEGSDGNRYITTAGHCVLKYDGRKIWKEGEQPWAEIDDRRAGHFVYAVLDYSEDFALIKLDPDFPYSPAMMHFGGPTGLYTDHSETPVGVHWTGNAMVVGNTLNHSSYGVGDDDYRPLPSRSGIALHTEWWDVVYAHAIVHWGDSGSGVIAEDGRALGTWVLISTEPDYGTAVASRLDFSIALAQFRTGISFTLQTAPLNPQAL